jgi:hypothetical protein
MAAVVLTAAPLAAQQPPATVQLPTLHHFALGTSVLVPDRGAAYLGGVGSARFGRNAFGLPLVPGSNRATSRQLGAAGVSVSAWIHDFPAMDEALLQQAAAAREARPDPPGPRIPPDDPLPQSLEAIARAHAAADAKLQREAADYLARGLRAEASGKPGLAKIYYRMAHRRASGDLKAEAKARLRGLEDSVAEK